MNNRITFKEVFAVEDLEKCFQLRLRKYGDYCRQAFLEGNSQEIDIDPFDLYSKHWAVYNQDNEIISCARIVQEEKNWRIEDQIKALIEKYKITKFSCRISNFPIVNYQSDDSRQGLASFLKDNTRKLVFELSRFVVENDSSLKIPRFTINAGLGIYKYCYQSEMMILSCADKHEKFWHHYGFKKIKENSAYETRGAVRSVNLYSQLTNIHPRFDQELEE
ncbi:MAG: GNAT family N-acyltransferase, partial [Bacteroidota bacterium]